jgi:hypothetical protein
VVVYEEDERRVAFEVKHAHGTAPMSREGLPYLEVNAAHVVSQVEAGESCAQIVLKCENSTAPCTAASAHKAAATSSDAVAMVDGATTDETAATSGDAVVLPPPPARPTRTERRAATQSRRQLSTRALDLTRMRTAWSHTAMFTRGNVVLHDGATFEVMSDAHWNPSKRSNYYTIRRDYTTKVVSENALQFAVVREPRTTGDGRALGATRSAPSRGASAPRRERRRRSRRLARMSR